MSYTNVMKGHISDAGGEVRIVHIDSTTHSLISIEHDHHEIHAGESFSAHIQLDVGSGNTLAIGIRTPNTTRWAHMTFTSTFESETEIVLWELATPWTGGTTFAPRNRNRNSGTAATVVVNTQPTVDTTNATILTAIVFGTSSGGPQASVVGGETRGTQEWILKQNTDYAFIATNQAGEANEMSIIVDWYEHTNET